MSTPRGAVGVALLAALLLMALAAELISPYWPLELHTEDKLLGPSGMYWFGTDELGRDILSRVIWGARVSLVTGVGAVAIATIAGATTGLLAGHLGGWVDVVTMRLWDTLGAFPAIFLAIAIVAIIGPGYLTTMLAVGFVYMPVFARLVRGTVLVESSKEYVEAARCLGAPARRIMFRTLLPNCLSPVIVQMALAAPAAIVTEASLSYLGLGVQAPDPSWGNMLQAAQQYLRASPTYGIFPGVAIALLILSLNFVGDSLQDALDPRRRRAR